MGLSVAISGGIMIVAFAMVMMMFPSIANNIFSVQQVSTSISEHNDIISKTDISTRRLETEIASPYVNFTLVNQGAYNLWKFDSFNLYVEYDAAGPVKRTEELTFGGQCLGGVPQVRKWCIETITNDYKDPDILNLGEGARIRTTLSQNLATTNAVVTVVTDNGVINTSGYDFTVDITTLETLTNVTDVGCGLNQIIKVNSTGDWSCSDDKGSENSFHVKGSTRWYSGNVGSPATVTIASTANVLRAFPFIVSETFAIDRIQFEVTANSGGTNCVVGIYDTLLDGSLYPGNLIVQGTGQSTGAPNGARTDIISATLNGDTLYWLAYNCSGTPTLRGYPVTNIPNVLGSSGTFAASQYGTGWTVARVYNPVLPATYPGGGTVLTNVIATFIQVRAQ